MAIVSTSKEFQQNSCFEFKRLFLVTGLEDDKTVVDAESWQTA